MNTYRQKDADILEHRHTRTQTYLKTHTDTDILEHRHKGTYVNTDT